MISTPYGSLSVLDAHTHFFSHRFYEALGAQLGVRSDPACEVAKRLNWDPAPTDPAAVARRWLAEMDRHGVERMVSIHTLPSDLESAGAGVKAANGRLIGYAMVNPREPDAAAIVRRAVTEYAFRGVALFPSMHSFAMNDDVVTPILQIADERALNVFVHCGVLKIGFRAKLGLPTAFDIALSNPLKLCRAAGRFSRARFIIPHLGSGFFRELLMLADGAGNVYSDTSGVGGWAKYLDGNPSKAAVLRQAVDVMGPDRLLFGSDSTFFPRGWRKDVFDEQVRIFEQAKLSRDEVEMILGGNLQRMMDEPQAK